MHPMKFLQFPLFSENRIYILKSKNIEVRIYEIVCDEEDQLIQWKREEASP